MANEPLTDRQIRSCVESSAALQQLLDTKRVEIGGYIRLWRLKREIGQPALAEVLGVSSAMVQHYETGRNALTAQKLIAIADTLKCKTTDLIP